LSQPIHTDVLVLGCGIAGGTAALDLAEAGLDVLIVTRADRPQESNTYWAQGGIIFKGEDDAPALLAKDIAHAGDGLCHDQAVAILAESGPALVQSILLDRLKVPFDRQADGSLALGREGGHSLPRIVHATDATGRAIEDALIAELARHPRVRFLTGHTAVDLLTPAHHGRDRRSIYDPLSCVGAYALDQATGEIIRCFARATVLATGGLGQIFLRTTNPVGSRGDGLAMAYRAGARVIAIVSNDDKARIARELGAAETINYKTEALVERVQALTSGNGADCIIDLDAAAHAPHYGSLLRFGGKAVIYGTNQPLVTMPFGPMILGFVNLYYFIVYKLPQPLLRETLAGVDAALARPGLRHPPVAIYALDAIAAAHEQVERGANAKVLIRL
jgi:D-arabinose 1-dehydrogenase-like Zn-dependent alcohol dehydrogenase